MTTLHGTKIFRVVVPKRETTIYRWFEYIPLKSLKKKNIFPEPKNKVELTTLHATVIFRVVEKNRADKDCAKMGNQYYITFSYF